MELKRLMRLPKTVITSGKLWGLLTNRKGRHLEISILSSGKRHKFIHHKRDTITKKQMVNTNVADVNLIFSTYLREFHILNVFI